MRGTGITTVVRAGWARLNAWYGLLSAHLTLVMLTGAVGGTAVIGIDMLGLATVLLPETVPLLLLALVIVGLVRRRSEHSSARRLL